MIKVEPHAAHFRTTSAIPYDNVGLTKFGRVGHHDHIMRKKRTTEYLEKEKLYLRYLGTFLSVFCFFSATSAVSDLFSFSSEHLPYVATLVHISGRS